jgi:CRISPR-associated endonuclease/helicase Cas3
MQRIFGSLAGIGLEEHGPALETAARFHDWGKAHPVFQQTLHNTPDLYSGADILAKQKRRDAARGHSRRFFRHELASALAMLATGEDELAAYLVAAHHGRVRVAIRSMPGERASGRDFIRGLEEGDLLLTCSLGNGVTRDTLLLTIEPAQLGDGGNGESWTGRVLRLRDRWGPFRLAYLEMLLRAADERASEMAAERLT